MMKTEMLSFLTKPFNSWILNEDTCLGSTSCYAYMMVINYNWNEQNQTWDLI
jgi:hypothetical protein